MTPIIVEVSDLKKDLEKENFNAQELIEDLPLEDQDVLAEKSTAQKIAEKRPQIILNKQKTSSGLSLSSIKKKREHEIRQMEVILDEDELPKETFTENELLKSWNTYVDEIERKGKFNLASILRIDAPKLQDTTVFLEFPNSTNKIELERQKTDLLRHLRTGLNNFDIKLSISVNETLEKQYAYTPEEKYNKLKDKNKNIDLLRKTFDLDF